MSAYEEATRFVADDKLASHANHSLHMPAVYGLISMAESQADTVTPSEMDARPDLLNFLNGTLDLSTGLLSPHSPTLLLTKLVHYDYNPAAACPIWLRFLYEILDYDEDLISYVQSALGYSLTGHTSDKSAFVIYGSSGNNGKSTFLSTFRSLIHEYSALILPESIMKRRFESSNTQADLADLCGSRFAQTSESAKGEVLSPATLKRISQGTGEIRGAKKYQNPISFPETHKLWIDTNFQPSIEDSEDTAIFSRLSPIHFAVQIGSGRRDPRLPEKLRGEAEGILAWAAAGALAWYRAGRRLTQPESVRAEVKAWQRRSSWLERFLSDCCLVATTKHMAQAWSIQSSILYEAYKQWAEDGNDAFIRSNREFTAMLRSHPSIRYTRKASMRCFYGVTLVRPGKRVGWSGEEE
jgi:putative DNA primase/helicase